jgi:type IV fimbrial biogenesis protein FimT
MRPPARPPAGITPIELAIALTVIGIVLSLAAPSLRGLMDRHALRGSADSLRSDLQSLRAEGIARSQRLWLAVQSGAAGSCYVAYTGNRGDCSCDAQGESRCNSTGSALRAAGFAATGRVRLSSNVGPMRFDPVLGTVSPAGTFSLSTPESDSVDLVVSMLGRVRSCTRSGMPGYPACS